LENLSKANEDLELKVSERTVELNKTNEELLAINSLKDKLFTVISHDLRQPVLSFEVLLETIRSYKDKLTKKKFEFLTTAIQSQLTEVKDLMDNLLNWAMVQMQYHELNKQDFDLKNSLKRNLELYSEQANEKRIKLSLHENKGKEYVNGDENMYDVVLRNLLSNAVKFTDRDGEIDCSIDHTKSHIIVRIKDNGRGVPKETKEKLFKNMEMITTRGTAKEKGIGIGLKLCKEFVEMQGGKLSLESEVGEGSVFSFTVPK
jgi:signal transduction histidine kinase